MHRSASPPRRRHSRASPSGFIAYYTTNYKQLVSEFRQKYKRDGAVTEISRFAAEKFNLMPAHERSRFSTKDVYFFQASGPSDPAGPAVPVAVGAVANTEARHTESGARQAGRPTSAAPAVPRPVPGAFVSRDNGDGKSTEAQTTGEKAVADKANTKKLHAPNGNNNKGHGDDGNKKPPHSHPDLVPATETRPGRGTVRKLSVDTDAPTTTTTAPVPKPPTKHASASFSSSTTTNTMPPTSVGPRGAEPRAAGGDQGGRPGVGESNAAQIDQCEAEDELAHALSKAGGVSSKTASEEADAGGGGADGKRTDAGGAAVDIESTGPNAVVSRGGAVLAGDGPTEDASSPTDTFSFLRE
eukprot:6202538-Pleurochrysis_carterae.AAC.1